MFMIGNDFWAKVAGLGIFYRWHPAIALRYLPFVSWIKSKMESSKILEVGSAGLGIAPYLKREVTGIDVDFKPPFHPFLRRVKASCTKLPFTDSSYDIVLSMDLLEHLNREDRVKSISEMIRVAKKSVLIGFPSGKLATDQDILLHKYYKNKYGKNYQFFEEQIHEGLPEKEEIHKIIIDKAKHHKKKIKAKIIGNENISLHNFLMRGWMTKNVLVDIFFRKILLFAIPILRIIDQPPYYRQLFFVEIKYENSN